MSPEARIVTVVVAWVLLGIGTWLNWRAVKKTQELAERALAPKRKAKED